MLQPFYAYPRNALAILGIVASVTPRAKCNQITPRVAGIIGMDMSGMQVNDIGYAASR
jgi:hypothetical protein